MSRAQRVLPLLVLALLCTPALAGRVVRSEAIATDKLRHETGTDELRHEFSQQPEKIRIQVQCKLKKGELSLKVVDPQGNVVWERQVDSRAKLDLQEEIPGVAGEWRIALDYAEAKGRYHIKMEGVGFP